MTPSPHNVRTAPSVLTTGAVSHAVRPRFFIPAIALFAGVALFAIPALRAVDTEDDVLAGAIDLGDNTSGATYMTPATTTSDVTFAAGTTYTNAASFGLGTALSIGSLDDLNATAITINGTALLTLNATTGANVVAPTGTPAGTSADSLYVASGGSLTLNDTAGISVVNTSAFDAAGALDLGTTGITITAAKVLSFTGAGATNVGGVIAATTGAVTVSKAGGSVTFGGANLYTGGSNITAGTLQLSGGNDRLLNTGTVNFSGSGTLSLNGAISQTLGNITVANGFTGTVTGATGTLTVTGTPVTIGGTATTQTLDLSGLGTFNYNNTAGAFNVGGTSTTSASAGTVRLAPVSTITASTVGLGTIGGTSGSNELGQGTLNLGATATINANTIQLGGNQSQGTINYAASTASPTLTLRGSDGSSRVTNLTIGQSASFTNTANSLVDLTTNVTGTGNFDAMVTTLTIGNFLTRGGAPASAPTVNGTLLMGGGTLDATTIILGQSVADPYSGGNLLTATGTLTVTGGTVRVQTLSLGNQNNNTTGTTAGANTTVTGTFNLNGGANLYAATINQGTGTGNRPATRTFNWNAGTIHNYDANTDLTINNNLTTFALLGTGAHTFNIDANRQGTVAQVISGTGAGGLTKAGAGTLTFTGVNTYTGATTVGGGTLALAATGQALSGTTAMAVNNGGTLLFSLPNQVRTATPIALGTTAAQTPASTTGILSFAAAASQGSAATVTGGSVTGTAPNGGTITTGGTVTGTTAAGLGALTLNNTATLAFAGGSTTLVFGTFTPNGNVLTITGYVNTGSTTAGSSGMGTDDRLVFSGDQSANLADFNFGSGAGVGVNEIALNNGFYEVTALAAVPEPSTNVGCLVLTAGTAWIYRRRFQVMRS